jgi:hypothetical protein
MKAGSDQQWKELGGVSMRRLVAGLLLIYGLSVSASILRAEVKTEEKTQFKMEGMMGRMMGMFAGKAAKEGVVSTVAVKGNRKITTSENASEIIDLAEEKIYSLDLKKKNYTVMTFEEMRQRLREAQEKAAKAAKDNSKEAGEAPDKQMEMDFSMKESGQKRLISGYDCREVVMTITMREKGKTLEEAGGMVMSSHIWLGPSIPAMKEITDFDQRYAKAMALAMGFGSAEQMAMMTAMYPGMKAMMGKMQNVNMDGTPILTEMTTEAVKTQAQIAQEQNQKKDQADDSSGVTSVRGLGGMLGRSLSRKKNTEEEAGKPKDRSTLFSTTHELLKIETSVPDSDVTIPAGFKEKK